MTDTPSQMPGPSPVEGRVRGRSRGRRAASAVALVTGGLLAGGLLATSLSATAQTTEPNPDSTSETRECGPGGAYQPLDEETTASIEAAVTEAHPGATVLRARELADGGYHVHVQTAEDERLVLTLDEGFAITETVTEEEMPNRGPGGFGHRHLRGDAVPDEAEEPTDDATTQTSAFAI
jgi:hypothetical protein